MNFGGRLFGKLNKKDKIRQQEEQRKLEELAVQKEQIENEKLRFEEEQRQKNEEIKYKELQKLEQGKLDKLLNKQQQELRKLDEIIDRQREEKRIYEEIQIDYQKENERLRNKQQEELRRLDDIIDRQREEQIEFEELQELQVEHHKRIKKLKDKQQRELKTLDEIYEKQKEANREFEELLELYVAYEKRIEELQESQIEEHKDIEMSVQLYDKDTSSKHLTKNNEEAECLNGQQILYDYNLYIEYIHLIEDSMENSTVFDPQLEQEKISDRYYEEIFGMLNYEDEISEEQTDYYQNLFEEYVQFEKEQQKLFSIIESELEQILEEEQEDEIVELDFIAYYNYYFDENDLDYVKDINRFIRYQHEEESEDDFFEKTYADFMFPKDMYLELCRIYQLDSSDFIDFEIVEGLSFLWERAECIIINDMSFVKMTNRFFESFIEYVSIREEEYNDIIGEIIGLEFEREERVKSERMEEAIYDAMG